ncbi:MAG: tryptophan 7-halogenase [Bryobacterales bacterium]|nr:tryptophan 7-halogenase [Bryobacterales bacterium]
MRASNDCDVVIAGGGPAGSAAAIWCARHGLRTVLLETQSFPRDRPGESLHPGVEPLFRQLGVERAEEAAGFPRYRGHWVSWGGPWRFEEFGSDSTGPWLGIQAWRATLDSILLEAARGAGVEVLQPCRALAPMREGKRIVGVSSEAGEIRARFTIDATGSRHWLSRKAGLPTRRASPRLIATYGYCAGDPDVFGEEPVLEGNGTGWVWIAPVRPALCAWTRLRFNHPDRHPPPSLRDMQPTGPTRGADVTWRIVDACAGDGYYVAGDAASVIDPASSHGVLKALMSGILAADLIARVHGGSLPESAAGEAFREWTAGWFRRDTKRLAELYAQIDRTDLRRSGPGGRVRLRP